MPIISGKSLLSAVVVGLSVSNVDASLTKQKLRGRNLNYEVCEAGCSTWLECDLGLNCYDSVLQSTDVPDCPTSTEYVESGQNFCYHPRGGEISIQGENGFPVDNFPLQECQGICVVDSECDYGLICSDGKQNNGEIEGCFGRPVPNLSYCVEAPAGTLVIKGALGIPEAAFPLGECEGECDADSDCADGLTCQTRVGSKKIPGCEGKGNPGSNYCYDADKVIESPTPAPVPSDIAPGSIGRCEAGCITDLECARGFSCMVREANEAVHGCSAPAAEDAGKNICHKPEKGVLVHVGNDAQVREFSLRECEGDCDTDVDCSYGLVCMERRGNKKVPGCTGPGIEMEDYCIEPPTENTLILKGVKGLPEKHYPLLACQGDCDTDEDCEGNLRCYQREEDNASDLIPGCDGFGVPTWDYCYEDPGTPEPSAAPSAAPSSAPSTAPSEAPSTSPSSAPSTSPSSAPVPSGPLGRCEVGCNSNFDCEPGLNCQFRDGGEQIPGCSKKNKFAQNVCYEPPADELVHITDDGDSSKKTVRVDGIVLKECQGDCDSDMDCDWGLKCKQRDMFETVTGCKGLGNQGEDYCFKPTNSKALVIMGMREYDVGPQNYNFKACQGHCESNADCKGNLVCFKRTGKKKNAAIPKCKLEPEKGVNYCVNKSWNL